MHSSNPKLEALRVKLSEDTKELHRKLEAKEITDRNYALEAHRILHEHNKEFRKELENNS